jgi:hypothetical protein
VGHRAIQHGDPSLGVTSHPEGSTRSWGSSGPPGEGRAPEPRLERPLAYAAMDMSRGGSSGRRSPGRRSPGLRSPGRRSPGLRSPG